ncbi:MAG TPA: hypothetical protein DCQ98_07195 [Planctomycetaceae bacterium]|nr:hypothetical protein [Planctomycetaceae bacterium]
MTYRHSLVLEVGISFPLVAPFRSGPKVRSFERDLSSKPLHPIGSLPTGRPVACESPDRRTRGDSRRPGVVGRAGDAESRKTFLRIDFEGSVLGRNRPSRVARGMTPPFCSPRR